jgi:hypothetical protein
MDGCVRILVSDFYFFFQASNFFSFKFTRQTLIVSVRRSILVLELSSDPPQNLGPSAALQVTWTNHRLSATVSVVVLPIN